MNRKNLKQFQIKKLAVTGTSLMFGISTSTVMTLGVSAQMNSGSSNQMKLPQIIATGTEEVYKIPKTKNCEILVEPTEKVTLDNLFKDIRNATVAGNRNDAVILNNEYWSRMILLVQILGTLECESEVAKIATAASSNTAATANLKLFPNSEQIGYGYYAPFDGSPGKNTTDFMKNRQQNLAAISASLANIDVKDRGLPSYFRLNTNVSPTEGKIEIVETQSQLNRFLNAKAKVSGGIGKFRASLDASYSGSSSFSEKEMRAVRKLQIPYYEIEMDIPALKRVLAAAAQLPPLPKDGNYQQFFQTYGTHFKSGVLVGGEATMTLTTTDSSKITKQEMSADLSARSTFVSGSASVNAGTAQTDASKGFTFSVKAKGGNQSIAASLTNFDANKFNQWSASVKDAALPIQEEYSPIWELYDGNDAVALKAAYEELQNEVLAKPPKVQFSGAGAIAGISCLKMFDSVHPSLVDNFLCTDDPRFFGISFANTPGAVNSAKNDDKANCQMYVDPQQNVKGWEDNALCTVQNSPIQLAWTTKPEAKAAALKEGYQCTDTPDPNGPAMFQDDAICYKVKDQATLIKWRQDSLYE